eukprot:CAMPEP_0195597582 /NCGR_PEP_ID=MMETSP0815-20121206/3060_1 /TAXON_ID=97485 /ORGANISM="Prymnesium parvum, Strain Texoma1" /LENGTH=169 /DNA_ID=CAMNT_0040736929 /DNA_START=182 /DNA_END=687 /DNA_ORIENTATION=-
MMLGQPAVDRFGWPVEHSPYRRARSTPDPQRTLHDGVCSRGARPASDGSRAAHLPHAAVRREPEEGGAQRGAPREARPRPLPRHAHAACGVHPLHASTWADAQRRGRIRPPPVDRLHRHERRLAARVPRLRHGRRRGARVASRRAAPAAAQRAPPPPRRSPSSRSRASR